MTWEPRDWSAFGPDENLETLIVPRSSDLGDGFQMQRTLPAARRRMVGPFVFLDQMGPGLFPRGGGLDVRPHPHIGLATVTYLFSGELLHRDSLGVVQPIRPGELNWMTAGRGIVHSERTPPELRNAESELFGAQAWVALPQEHEEIAPSFSHNGAAELPVLEGEGKQVRLIAGELYGARSPVAVLSPLFYADVALATGASLVVPTDYEERAIYVVEGAVETGASRIEAGRLAVFKPRIPVTLQAACAPVRLLLGGEPLDGPRYIWWNFVSSSRERIEQAKEDWRGGRFSMIPGETDHIPLPGERPPPVMYP